MDRYGAETFKHEPLDGGPTSFRSLRLLPARSQHIKCELVQSNLSTCEPYEALSYAWGSTELEELVTINDQALWNTDSLHIALRHLALPDRPRLLWVDGICISQHDDTEKSQQVQRMRAIYSEAVSVIIWLGKASVKIQILFEGLQRFLEEEEHTIERARVLWLTTFHSQRLREKSESGLQTLLHRPWFQRVWILQEVAVARYASVHAGWTGAPANIFALAAQMIEAVGPEAELYWRPVIEVMPGIARKTSWWAEKPDLYSLLWRFRKSSASDLRDMVYALLGLSWDSVDRQTIIPDYSKPPEEVFQDVLRHFIQSERSTVDRVLNIAAAIPTVVTLLVNVQDDSTSGFFVLDCQQKNTATVQGSSHRSRQGRDLVTNDRSTQMNARCMKMVAICKTSALLFVTRPAGDPSDPRPASLYSEVSLLLRLPRSAENESRPDVGTWGSSEDSVLLLNLEKSRMHAVFAFAVASGFVSIVNLLLDMNFVQQQHIPAAVHDSTLMAALRYGDAELVRSLLDSGIGPNVHTCVPESPLGIAAIRGRRSMIELLIERGAKVDASSLNNRFLDYVLWRRRHAALRGSVPAPFV